MASSEWQRFKVAEGKPVVIDLEDTPLEDLVTDTNLVKAIASRVSTGEVEITVVRNDPNDEPTPINIDTYFVYEDMTQHTRFEEIVDRASTEDNSNLRQALAGTVFLVKQLPGPDHWSSEIPATIIHRTT